MSGQPRMTMTGGSISGNSAGSGGGGLFVQCGLNSVSNNGKATYGVATITGGSITDNAMAGGGNENNAFGGGGIYVNGYAPQYSTYHNGELYLYNVEVADNSADVNGGGYAACPVSRTEIELTNGAVFYNNTAQSAQEIFIQASLAYGAHSGNPPYDISPSMLGGFAYHWTYDDGSEVPLDKLKGTLIAWRNESLSLNNNLKASDASVQQALSQATVHITGNTSTTRGGGIGSNGSVFIGKSVETTSVSASKTWVDDDNAGNTRPSSLKVELYRNGNYVGYQDMAVNSDGSWPTITFANLPKADDAGQAYTYTIKERAMDGYVGTVSGSAAEGFTITNTLATSVSVEKKWDGKEGASATFHLLANGQDTGKTLTVTASDNWKGAFTDLPKYTGDGTAITYTVTEDPMAGYTTDIAGNAQDGFTVTNTAVPATVNIPVTKVWNDENDADGTRPDSVTVHLYADGSDTGKTVTLNDGNSWKASFDGLAQNNTADGHEIAYTVQEDAVDGYTAQVSGTAAEGFTITNTHTPTGDTPGGDTPHKNTTPPAPPTVLHKVISMLPKTGDSLPIGAVVAAVAVAGVALGVSLRARRKRGKHAGTNK